VAQSFLAPLNSASTSPAASGSVTPDLTANNEYRITMPAGNVTINNATTTTTMNGVILEVQVTQDGTGGRTLTWGSTYNTAWQPNPAGAAVSSVRLKFDGTNWQNHDGVHDSVGNATLGVGSTTFVQAKSVFASMLTGLPTTAAGVAGVVTCTPAVGSNDTRGRFTIASSVAVAANSQIAVISWNTARTTPSTLVNPVVLVVNSSQAANSTTAFSGSFGTVNASSAGFTLVTSATTGTFGSANTITADYWVIS
jgi:hypothetical protein